MQQKNLPNWNLSPCYCFSRYFPPLYQIHLIHHTHHSLGKRKMYVMEKEEDRRKDGGKSERGAGGIVHSQEPSLFHVI